MTLYDTNHNIHAINNAEINTSSYARISKKKKKIGINVFTSQKLVNLFFFAVQYYRSWYTSVVYSSPVTQGKHVLHILLHIDTEYTYFGMRGGTDKQQVTGLYYYSNILIETSLLSLRY